MGVAFVEQWSGPLPFALGQQKQHVPGEILLSGEKGAME
jgi:hypothetical protein